MSQIGSFLDAHKIICGCPKLVTISVKKRYSVLIIGGGPFGLMLANELGRRNISTLLIDEKSSTAFNPQANATQARTMEHFRRHGFADEVRALGLPADYPTDIAYFTRYAGYELARFSLPSSGAAKSQIQTLTGSWSAAELPHRVSQKWVEKVLHEHALACRSNTIRFNHRLLDFEQRPDGITATIENLENGAAFTVSADYLVGADGARSLVRQSLGFHYLGESGAVRDFMGGRMHAMYIRVPGFYSVSGHAPAWMNVTYNRDRRAFMAAVDGKSEFAFHTQLRADEDETALSDADAIDMFRAAMGTRIDVEILSRGTWRAGFTLVVEHMQSGRIFLGGDAAHLFTPAGGLGYNTAIEDAVNLGWKLAAVVRGSAPHSLLASYEQERRPAAVRNTSYARQFAESLGANAAPAELEDDSPAGAEARARAGEYFNRHARKEFNIPGITFGCRYDGSPIIVADGDPPPDRANVYIPTSCPGGRAPHLWLGEDHSLYDEFGFEWTLLRLGPKPPPATEIQQAFAASGLELKVLDIPGETARDLYETDLALIRPDQVVAFRGQEIRDPRALTARVSGRVQPETDPEPVQG